MPGVNMLRLVLYISVSLILGVLVISKRRIVRLDNRRGSSIDVVLCNRCSVDVMLGRISNMLGVSDVCVRVSVTHSLKISL